jgi:uncharacterized protein (DUF58 family)
MDFPDDTELNKFTYTRRLLAGLGYVSLTANDRLLVTAISGGGEVTHFGPARGRAYGVRLLSFVNDLRSRGTTDLNAVLRDYAMRAGRPGLCLVISDMFSPSGYIDGLNALLGKGYEVAMIHVLSPDEIEPPLAGDLRLLDAETGAAQEVSVDSSMRDLYVRRVEEWRDSIRMECVRRNVHYIPVDTRTPWEKVILFDLRRLGIVK